MTQTGTVDRKTTINGASVTTTRHSQTVQVETRQEDTRVEGNDLANLQQQLRAERLQRLELQAQLEQSQPTTAATTMAHTWPGALVPEHPLPVKSFGDYTPAEQLVMEQRAKKMADAGRLFFQQNPGDLPEKGRGFNLFQALEYGDGRAYEVAAGARHSVGETSQANSRTGDQDEWQGGHDHNFITSGGSSDSGTTSVNFSAKAISSWEAFAKFVSDDGQGVPEVSVLPDLAASVQVAAWKNSTTSSGFDYHLQRGYSAHYDKGDGFQQQTYWER